MSSLTAPVHSPLGASSYSRWRACPGSVRLSVGCEKQESAYAAEGTAAHQLAADILEHKPYITPDEETLAAVMTYVDFVNSHSPNPGEKLIEHRFDLSKFYPNLYGTADCVIYYPAIQKMIVIDYKHGAGVPVEVKENPQLMYYGLGAISALNKPVRELELVIVQPRCFHSDGPIRSWKTTAGRVLDFLADLIDDAKATESPHAPLKVGDHCRWCPAQPQCPALKEKALVAARQAFSSVTQYEPAELAEMLANLPAIESWIKSVREFAYREAEHGRIPPGWKLVEKRKTRKWKTEWAEGDKIAREFGLKGPEVIEVKLKSPAQIEKIAPKELRKRLTEMVVQESSGLTLVEESDGRLAVTNSTAREVFEVVEE